MANTPDGTVRLSAIDCISRGAANGLARWPLIGVQWLRDLVLWGLLQWSFAIPIAALGLNLDVRMPQSPEAALDWLAGWSDRLVPSPELFGALGAMFGLWLVAGFVYCFFQASVIGVLAAAERSAPLGTTAPKEAFGAFRWRELESLGRARVGRYFGLANLYGAYVGVVLLVALLVAVGVTELTWHLGMITALLLGCFSLLPALVVLLLFDFWYRLASAALANEGATVRTAARRASEIFRRRLGAVAFLLVSFAAASMATRIVLSPLSAVAAFSSGNASVAARTFRVCLEALALLPRAALSVLLVGASVALVRSEENAT